MNRYRKKKLQQRHILRKKANDDLEVLAVMHSYIKCIWHTLQPPNSEGVCLDATEPQYQTGAGS